MEQPEKPDPEDCCNSGCASCIHDIYEDNVKKYKLYLEGKLPTNIIKKKNLLSQIKYTKFVVLHVENISFYHKLILFIAKDVSEEFDLSFLPGQHFILQSIIHGDSIEAESKFTRAYTPLALRDVICESSESVMRVKNKIGSAIYFQILVKLYENGKMSTFLRDLVPGSETLWRGPFGNYKYQPNSTKYLLMIGQGTGIAPLISIASSVTQDEFDDTSIIFFCCFRNVKEILLRNVLYDMRQFWNFSYKIFLSHTCQCVPDDCFCKPNLKYLEPILNRRLNNKDILDIVINKKQNIECLICGSTSFMSSYQQIVECYLDKDKIKIF